MDFYHQYHSYTVFSKFLSRYLWALNPLLSFLIFPFHVKLIRVQTLLSFCYSIQLSGCFCSPPKQQFFKDLIHWPHVCEGEIHKKNATIDMGQKLSKEK